MSFNRFTVTLIFGLASVLTTMLTAGTALAEEMTADSMLSAYIEQVNDKHVDVTKALAVFKQGKFDEARKLLQSATTLDPSLPPAGILLTRMFIAAGQRPLARAELQRLTEEYPEDAEAFLGIGELAISENRLADARLAIEKASSLAKQQSLTPYRQKKMQARIHLSLATLAEHQQRWKDSVKSLQAAADLQPHDQQIVARLARSLFKSGDRESAFTQLKEQSQPPQDAPGALVPELTMGLLAQEEGDDTSAEKWMKKAAVVDRKAERTQIAVAHWALENGNTQLARTCAQQAAENSDSSMPSRLVLALVARYEKDYSTARELLESVHLESPANLAAVIELSIVLSHIEGMENRALQYAQVGVKLQPNLKTPAGRNAAIATARILHQYGGAVEAEKIANQVLSIGPVSVESSYYAAVILLETNPATAKQLLENIVASQRRFPGDAKAKQLLQNTDW